MTNFFVEITNLLQDTFVDTPTTNQYDELADSLFIEEKYKEAIYFYDKALEIKPDNHDLWYKKAQAFEKLENYEEAISSYDRILDIVPNKYEIYGLKGLAFIFSEHVGIRQKYFRY